jgi:hypothetical protein
VKIEGLIADGHFAATELVLTELEKKDDDAYQWARRWKQMFVPIDQAIQLNVRAILADHERLVDQRKGRSGADPFVIALAEMNGCAVVTDEDVGNEAKPHIPYVCRARRIRVLSVLELIQEERWVI